MKLSAKTSFLVKLHSSLCQLRFSTETKITHKHNTYTHTHTQRQAQVYICTYAHHVHICIHTLCTHMHIHTYMQFFLKKGILPVRRAKEIDMCKTSKQSQSSGTFSPLMC